MKKKTLFLIFFTGVFLLAGCSQPSKPASTPTGSSEEKQVETTAARDAETIVNNVMVGGTKISFNNTEFNRMSDGQFKEHELWGTFESDNFPGVHVQLDVSDMTTDAYGTIAEYQLADVQWQESEQVYLLGLMEEAVQLSKDGKAKMYKGRTGDVLISVAIFSEKKLTDQELLALESLVSGIKLEYTG